MAVAAGFPGGDQPAKDHPLRWSDLLSSSDCRAVRCGTPAYKVSLAERAHLSKAPEVLERDAAAWIARFCYLDRSADRAYGFDYAHNVIR
jgi:hypothetical protein